MVMEYITAAKTFVGLVKETKSLLPEKDTEIRNSLLNLQEKALDMQSAMTELAEENRSLNAKLKLKDKMVFRAPYYFQKGDEVPFCPVCFENDEKAIHLHLFDSGNKGKKCLACKNSWVEEKFNYASLYKY